MRPWPDLNRQDLLDVADAIYDSESLAAGDLVVDLECRVSYMYGGMEVVAVNSATSGLEAILYSIGAGPGKEVIVPEYGFPAAAISAKRLGANVLIAPISAYPGMMIDPDAVYALITPETCAVVGIDVGAYPADWGSLESICRSRGVCLIEDAAPAWASVHAGRRLGSFGDAAVLSLSQTKMVAAGEGGLVLTWNQSLASRIRALRRYGEVDTGVSQSRRMQWAGANWKLNEWTAGIALLQIECLPVRAGRAMRNREALDAALAECNYLASVPVEPEDFVAPHKYRVLGVGAVDGPKLLQAAKKRLPILEDDVAVLWDHPAFYSPVRQGRVAGSLATSFLLGSRQYPLWHVPDEEVALWCDHLLNLDKEADQWLK